MAQFSVFSFRFLRWIVPGLWLGLFSATAQTLPLLDQNPPNLRWDQLRTPHFRVIFPRGFEGPAQQTARRLEQVYEPVSAGLERRPRPLSVILQNQTTVSNGFVTLLPRRSEFFAIPPQDPFVAGNLAWLDLLAIHEFRHVVQYDKALQGFSNVVYSVFGNSALAALTLGVPGWFWEGDAVGTETALTTGGRGRIPNFDLSWRANLLAGRQFTYAKAVSGSYRHNVPNEYVLGYFLTSYLKRTYGAEAWSGVLNRYYRFPLYPFAFSNSLKRTARAFRKENSAGKTQRMRVEDLYRQTMHEIGREWQGRQSALRVTDATDYPVSASERVYTNYRYPQYVSENRILAIKSGLGDISRLVLLDREGKEKKVFVQGLFNNPEMLSAGGGKVCWTENLYDPRFGQRIYSDIKVLDLKTGRLTYLKRRTRFSVASLSPDGSRIAAVRNDEQYRTRLVVLDARTGAEIRTFDNPENGFYLHPRWRDDNRTIVAVVRRTGGKTLQMLDAQDGTRRDLIPVTPENLSHPQPWRQYVFYNSPHSGIDNIYALDTETGKRFQVTSRPLGAYHATLSPEGRKLGFHDFRANGYRVSEMPLDPSTWVPVEKVKDEALRYFEPYARQEPGAAQVRAALADSVPATPGYPVERFSRLKNALNVYSWGPIASSSGQNLTLGLLSQDLLSTTQFELGLAYDQAERAAGYYANLSYQGLFPIIDLGFQGGRRNTSLYVDRRTPLDSLRSDRWHYDQFTAGLRLPLQLTRSRYLQSLSLSAYYNYIQVSGYDLPARPITEVGFGGSLSAMSYGLTYARTLRQAKRDVAPRWGQTFQANWRHTPFGGALTGNQWAAQGSLFFPGLGKHHSLRFRGGYQQQEQDSYRFSPIVFFPRGASYTSFDRLGTASVEYRLPLVDPDLTLGRWLYIQRIRATGFYDAAQGESRLRTQGREVLVRDTFNTAGFDVSFIFNFMRLSTPFELGVRTTYNINTGQWQVQPLVVEIGF
ncbi:hypothetical protein [Larkinella soli]|uniref:hypothetical protein n=1 Tax=Larkinella soli TaxID=1770527 RepID=UPI001E53A029|nr:hypothetical protein [Larkinella soli]